MADRQEVVTVAAKRGPTLFLFLFCAIGSALLAWEAVTPAGFLSYADDNANLVVGMVRWLREQLPPWMSRGLLCLLALAMAIPAIRLAPMLSGPVLIADRRGLVVLDGLTRRRHAWAEVERVAVGPDRVKVLARSSGQSRKASLQASLLDMPPCDIAQLSARIAPDPAVVTFTGKPTGS
ncbi:hypothetical protein HHL28_15980 [Aerophototrophica crusticola]|uniref:Uncharacterized protein n=1 Tax=Aerophototrophica crusticola TaxID=1709002 RepID=A0A858RAJ3_9PROT|nr:hypothetical protein HHL28_15980 [Rhodospirillaceae bacterium B3]